MSTSLPLSILLVVALGAAGRAEAQTPVEPYRPVTVQASLGDGRVSGIVMDEAGVALGGVSILATGTTLAVAQKRQSWPVRPGTAGWGISAPRHARGISCPAIANRFGCSRIAIWSAGFD